MYPIHDLIRILAAETDPDMTVKFCPAPKPKVKPERRQKNFENKSNRSDYSKEYMKEYREEGKDYQKKPDAVKELRRKQKESLKEKFDL
jgi:hypothetical protein